MKKRRQATTIEMRILRVARRKREIRMTRRVRVMRQSVWKKRKESR
jgi:hypothetical protein